MPVLGHAFVGYATAMAVRPSRAARVGAAFWIPLLIALAYLPDIAAQLAELGGATQPRVATHSLLFAGAASVLLAVPVGRLARVSGRRAFVVVLASVLLHDLCDLLQTTDRMPLWPISRRSLGPRVAVIPHSVMSEFVIFALGFVAFLGVRHRLTRRRRETRGAAEFGGDRLAAPRSWRILGRTLTGALLVMAGGTHVLRGMRERALQEANAALDRRDYAAAIRLAESVRRWPGVAKPGQIDYLEAEAHLGRGDRREAEQCYLRSRRDDPSYFWSLADLTVFYAAGPEPLGVRRQRSAAYVAELRTRFSGHPDFPKVMDKINRKLEERSP